MTADDRRYTPAELAAVAQWRVRTDPIRPPETDEEPWSPATLPEPRTWSMFGGENLAGWWAIATGVVAATLAAVLLVLWRNR